MRLFESLLKNKVFRNFSYLTIGSIVSQLLLLITVLKITSILSPEEYGLYTFTIAQGMLLHAISDLGIKAIIIRAIARTPEKTNDLLINGLKLRFFFLLILMVGYIGYNNHLGSLNNESIVQIGIYALVNSFFHMFEYVFLGHQKMLYPSIVKILHSTIWFLIVFLIPKNYFTTYFLINIYLVLNLAQVIIFYFLLKSKKLFQGKIEGFKKSSWAIFSESWPYFSLMLLTLPTNHLSNNFLDINSSQEQVGFFNLAKKLMSPVSLIITFALTALFPNLAALFETNQKRFFEILKKGVPIFLIIISISSFIFSMFSKEAVLLFFSSDYLPAIKVIQLQVWYVALNGINHLITIIYGAVNQEKKIFKLALISAVWSTPILYFGSYHGAMGISIGYVLSFAIYEIYFWLQFEKNINFKLKNIRSIWLITTLLFLISYFFPSETNYSIKIVISLILLILISFWFKKQLKII